MCPGHGENALGGGVGVGAWAPPDDGEGMDLDSVTDMVGAGDGARLCIGGLGSGQVRQVGGVAGALPDNVHASARQSANLVESREVDAATASRRDHVDGARSGIDCGGSMDETAVVPEDAPVDLDRPSVQGQESVSSQREQAGQRRDPGYVRGRQAKHTAKQNARRKRG